MEQYQGWKEMGPKLIPLAESAVPEKYIFALGS